MLLECIMELPTDLFQLIAEIADLKTAMMISHLNRRCRHRLAKIIKKRGGFIEQRDVIDDLVLRDNHSYRLTEDIILPKGKRVISEVGSKYISLDGRGHKIYYQAIVPYSDERMDECDQNAFFITARTVKIVNITIIYDSKYGLCCTGVKDMIIEKTTVIKKELNNISYP